MAERAVRVTITGRVQGVGFRDWLANKARQQGLSGWVRNRRDGRVEAVVAGDEEAIDAVIGACFEGPPMARVADVVTEAAAEMPAPGLEVLPTA